MPSQIEDVFDALCAWSFVIDDQTIAAPQMQQLETLVSSPNLPTRIISPALNRNEGKVEGQTFGNTSYQITWELDDLLLWRLVPQVPNAADENRSLVRYMVAYTAKWITARQLTTQTFSEALTNFSAGVFEYPAKSNNLYYGVLATHRIIETVTS